MRTERRKSATGFAAPGAACGPPGRRRAGRRRRSGRRHPGVDADAVSSTLLGLAVYHRLAVNRSTGPSRDKRGRGHRESHRWGKGGAGCAAPSAASAARATTASTMRRSTSSPFRNAEHRCKAPTHAHLTVCMLMVVAGFAIHALVKYRRTCRCRCSPTSAMTSNLGVAYLIAYCLMSQQIGSRVSAAARRSAPPCGRCRTSGRHRHASPNGTRRRD